MSEVRLLSFNLRWPSPEDGPNRWEFRSEAVVRFLREQRADLIGLQEAMSGPLGQIGEGLPGYRRFGVGRDDGGQTGEQCAIFVRSEAFDVVRTETFWFSDQPHVAGSRTWGNHLPRICTWVQLRDPDGREFRFANAHLDHESQPSRVRSTELLVERLGSDLPLVLAGDFNVGEANPALQTLRDAAMVDSYRAVHPDLPEPATFHDWGREATYSKIDYLWTRGVRVVDAAVVPGTFDGRWVSDHHAVSAVIEI